MDDPNEIGSPNRFILKDESYAIIGAALDVYYKLGSGFLEPVYQEALAIEFQLRDIPFLPQVDLPIVYKDFTLKKTYRADFVCYDSIIVEIKALVALTNADWAQLMNYLKASSMRVVLLFNFGSIPRMEHRSIII
jgi:GxxExxY protein